MRIATAALKKDIRIMRTPEDWSKLSQQVFWNKKIQGDACSNALSGAGSRRLEPLEPLELLEPIRCERYLEAHHATVSRQLNRIEQRSGDE
jgi:hypothetical protein